MSLKQNTAKKPSMSLGANSVSYKLYGVIYDTLALACHGTGLRPEEVLRKCDGYTTDNGLYIPPASRCKTLFTEDQARRVVGARQPAGFHGAIEIPIAMPTWNRAFSMHHWERMKLRHLIHTYTCHAHSGAQVTLQERAAMDALYLALIRPSKINKDRAKKCKYEAVEPERDEVYKHEEGQEYNLFFYHYRHRKVDNSNLSTKAFEDAIVRLGMIPDDSAKYVDETRDKQVLVSRSDNERTICRVFRKTTQNRGVVLPGDLLI